MKKFIKKIWYFFFPAAAINQVNSSLQKAVISKQVTQIKLMKEIRDYILIDLKIDKSKFIPLSVRKQVCNKVMKLYGKRMAISRLKLNTNLQLVKL